MADHNSGVEANLAELEAQIQETLNEIQQTNQKLCSLSTPGEFEACERKIGELTDRLAGLMTGLQLQRAIASEKVEKEAAGLMAAMGKKFKNQGQRLVEVKLLRGGSVRIWVSYYTLKKAEKKRKKRGCGLYPELMVLGIYDRCTPLLASEVSLLSVAASSFEEARCLLERQGIELDVKTIQEIAYRFARRAKVERDQQRLIVGEQVAGRRVTVSTDGGRVRLREKKKGAKRKKGKRSPYQTAWREPKLLIIYVINEKGEKEKTFVPLIDASLKGPGALMKLIEHYLRNLGITRADRVVFVADGAPWIWGRLPGLIASLGLKPEQVVEVIDFYHVVEHLGKVAELDKKWTSGKRKQWVKQQRKRLLEGKVEAVLKAVEEICGERKSQAAAREMEYFRKHQLRMQYAMFKSEGLPIGSGAVESAIRRVINLRLKGAGIFWKRENADVMLLMRSYYKAGRWEMLKEMAFARPLALVA